MSLPAARYHICQLVMAMEDAGDVLGTIVDIYRYNSPFDDTGYYKYKLEWSDGFNDGDNWYKEEEVDKWYNQYMSWYDANMLD